jgi:TRAP-type C4-dicarboxylate transport system substrate-binding protein
MGALWWMNNAKYESMSPDLKKVVTDGFYALQQATFASPKRKSIKAYEDFVAGGGDLYVPTPDQKASFKKAASPVYDWFKSNVKGGKEIFNALTKAVASAEKKASSAYKKDL